MLLLNAFGRAAVFAQAPFEVLGFTDIQAVVVERDPVKPGHTRQSLELWPALVAERDKAMRLPDNFDHLITFDI